MTSQTKKSRVVLLPNSYAIQTLSGIVLHMSGLRIRHKLQMLRRQQEARSVAFLKTQILKQYNTCTCTLSSNNNCNNSNYMYNKTLQSCILLLACVRVT